MTNSFHNHKVMLEMPKHVTAMSSRAIHSAGTVPANEQTHAAGEIARRNTPSSGHLLSIVKKKRKRAAFRVDKANISQRDMS